MLSARLKDQLGEGRGIPIASSASDVIDYTTLIYSIEALETRIVELEALIDDFDTGSPVLKGKWREMARQAKLGAAVEAMPTKSSLEHWDDGEWIYDEDHPIDQQTSRLKRGLEDSPMAAIHNAVWMDRT